MVRLVVLTMILVCVVRMSFELDIDQTTFIARLKELANDRLGISKFQQFVDKQQNSPFNFTSYIPNGQAMAAQIAIDIEREVQGYIAAVRRIQTAFNNGLDKEQIRTELCCDLPDLVYDSRFQLPVDTSKVCHLTRVDMSVNDDIRKSMINNLQTLPNIKWQYFGTEDGRHCTYPARSLCDKSYVFDPRVRPWYTGTVNIPRDIIILLDRSTPMGESYSSGQSKSKLTVARNAAAAILQYLNQNDRVAVVGFSNNIMTVNDTSCFGRELAVGNSDNIKQLSDFTMLGISQDNSGTKASFAKALRAANDIFNASGSYTSNPLFPDRERIILMLTSGDSLEDCQSLQSLETTLFNNTVNIFMMEISETAAPTPKSNCLRTLTQGLRGAHGVVPNSDFKDLRGQLGFFYNSFIDEIDRSNATFSTPFTDINGLGMETSVCLPLLSVNQQLLGVACVELSLADVLDQIVNFHLNKLSYGFVIDRRGRVLLHPLLPAPLNWQDELPLLDMTQVEISSYSSDVGRKIVSGVPGNQTISTKCFTSNGESILHGVTKFETTATYYWNLIPSMKFFMCLVIVQNELKSGLSWGNGLPSVPSVLLSDEMDLKRIGQCILNNRIALSNSGTSVVKLAPKAFQSAENYTQRNMTATDLSQLKQYIIWTGVQPQSFKVKDGVRDIVSATSVLDSYWIPLQNNSQLRQHILGMYIGTPEGVYRRYPPIQIPKTFDPTTRPWYTTAVSLTGQLVLTLPYVDYASKIPIVSLSQTVYGKSFTQQQHSTTDPILGVIGMDVTVKYMYNLITSTFTQCSTKGQECFVIDLGGFIVIHKEFQSTITNRSLHITVREQAIANELTQINVLTADACVNYAEAPLKKQLFWTTIISSGRCLQLSSSIICRLGSTDRADINTNLFLIIKQSASQSSGSCSCQNQTDADGGLSCTNVLSTPNVCQCPCRLPLNYDSCLSNMTVDPSTWKPCIPKEDLSTADSYTVTPDEQASLPLCMPCSFFTDELLCEANECCWTTTTSVCSSINTCVPSSRTTFETSSDFEANRTTTLTSHNTDRNLTLGLVIGLTLGLVFLLVVIVGLLIWFYKKRQRLSYVETHNPNYGPQFVTQIIVTDKIICNPDATRASDIQMGAVGHRVSVA